MKSAFVTGIGGQDGSYLSEALLRDGWEVHALVRPAVSGAENPIAEEVISHDGDLEDLAQLGDIITRVRPDVVFNLAGVSSVAASWEQPVHTARVTGLAVAAMLEACWKLHESHHEARFVQASSAEIFGAALVQPQDESTPIAPVNPYGAAKAYAHEMVGIYRDRGMFASAAILFNHESPRRPPAFVTRKITQGVARIATGLASTLVLGNLEATRDWGWAEDYVDALIRIAVADLPDDFVVATGHAHSVADFVEAAFKAVGIDDWREFTAQDERLARPVDAPIMRGDHTKISSELGWEPTMSFVQIVEAMVLNDVELIQHGG